MSRQVVERDVLILGDSNVRCYLGRCGGAYTQACDCGLARNMSEFGNHLKMVDATNYRIVIFAMMTNILIDAGSEGHDHQSRIHAMDECLSPLIENLRFVYNRCFPDFDISNFSYHLLSITPTYLAYS